MASAASQDQLLGAMRLVAIREEVRSGQGQAGVTTLDSFLRAGGNFSGFPTGFFKTIDDLVQAAASGGAAPGLSPSGMSWPTWACFCYYYFKLGDPELQATVRASLQAGSAKPWALPGSPVDFASPLDPCASALTTEDMFCCPAAVGGDEFYSGDMPGLPPIGWSAATWIIIVSGIVTAAAGIYIEVAHHLSQKD